MSLLLLLQLRLGVNCYYILLLLLSCRLALPYCHGIELLLLLLLLLKGGLLLIIATATQLLCAATAAMQA